VFLPDLVVRSRRVVTPRGTRPAAIHVRAGRVVGVLDFDDLPVGCPVDDVGGVVLPGVVDTRVHAGLRGPVSEVSPQRSRLKGFTSEVLPQRSFEQVTRSAAAGGVTTIVDMPFGGSPATTTVAALDARRRAASGTCWADVGFWAGVVPGNSRELMPLFEAGVLGFACVLFPCGDLAFPPVSETDLRIVMPGLAHIGATLLVHAELAPPVDAARARQRTARGWFNRATSLLSRSRRYATVLDSRPKAAENDGIALMIQLCREYQTSTHIVHLSSADALQPLFHARAAHLRITAETCPHYLDLVAEELSDEAAALLACAPPIRERENREFLWAALAHGLIQMTVADRFTPLELSLALMWTGAHARGYALDRVMDWMSSAPARLAGLSRKGKIDVGYDADLVVFEPDLEFVVEPESLHQRHLYLGRRLRGIVERTYLRGRQIYSRQDGWAASPSGTLVSRAAA
jgi:allantoinase